MLKICNLQFSDWAKHKHYSTCLLELTQILWWSWVNIWMTMKKTKTLIHSLSCSRFVPWAATCDFQQWGILTCVDSDEPVQPTFKLRNSKWCSVFSSRLIEYASESQRLWSDCAYAQSDLRLCWSHIPHCWKYHVADHIYWSPFITGPVAHSVASLTADLGVVSLILASSNSIVGIDHEIISTSILLLCWFKKGCFSYKRKYCTHLQAKVCAHSTG